MSRFLVSYANKAVIFFFFIIPYYKKGKFSSVQVSIIVREYELHHYPKLLCNIFLQIQYFYKPIYFYKFMSRLLYFFKYIYLCRLYMCTNVVYNCIQWSCRMIMDYEKLTKSLYRTFSYRIYFSLFQLW